MKLTGEVITDKTKFGYRIDFVTPDGAHTTIQSDFIFENNISADMCLQQHLNAILNELKTHGVYVDSMNFGVLQ